MKPYDICIMVGYMRSCNECVIEYSQQPCKINIPDHIPKEQIRRYVILRKPK
jgi:hypothetical protein